MHVLFSAKQGLAPTKFPLGQIAGGGGPHSHPLRTILLHLLSDMRAVVPLPMVGIYLLAIWANETLLPADSCWVKVVGRFWIRVVVLIGGGKRPWLTLICRALTVARFGLLELDAASTIWREQRLW